MKKIQKMGSGGSSRRRDADDNQYDSDDGDYGDGYDEQSMRRQERKERARELLKKLQSGDMMLLSTDSFNSVTGEDGVHLKPQAAVKLARKISASDSGILEEHLQEEVGINEVTPEQRRQLFQEFKRQRSTGGSRNSGDGYY